eukprot:1719807-Amphidinium_carterae.1
MFFGSEHSACIKKGHRGRWTRQTHMLQVCQDLKLIKSPSSKSLSSLSLHSGADVRQSSGSAHTRIHGLCVTPS